MNCCDEYGNCRQGRDCPARATPQRHWSNKRIYALIGVVVLGFWSGLGTVVWWLV